ncbi:MAG: hypothetical protein JO103_05655, partial [Candidatus Eremiobacteraeota bacterium]|nr:hypothetical protein [Candidatus Eremiobacteraeota bacterium]
MNGRSTVRAALLGAATGFSLGYAVVRAAQALRDLRAPAALRANCDPRRYGAVRRALVLAGAARGVAELATTAFLIADPL